MQPKPSKGDRPFKSVYQRVTEQVLTELDKGTAPWRKGWNAELGLPRNLESRKVYHGINTLSLMATALDAGYSTNWWTTLRQANLLGGRIKAGQHGVPVLFYSRQPEPSPDEDSKNCPVEATACTHILRVFTVFNIEQTTGLELPLEKPGPTCEPVELADQIVKATHIPVRYFGSEAYYEPTRDLITLPPHRCFHSVSEYYGTLLHETTHGTGHQSRLDRPFGPRGSDAYCWEELVGELGSAMLSVMTGVPSPNIANMAAYVDSWRTRMQRDARAICEAAATAQRAVEWLLTTAGLPLPE